MSSVTEFKTSSEDELSLLDVLNKTPQLDAVILRQIFLLLTRNFYSNPRAFNADGTNIPKSYYRYTYSDKIVDPEHKSDNTLTIDLGYSSIDNSIDKTDYLKNNQKPAIYIDVGDFTFEQLPVIDSLTMYKNDEEEHAIVTNTTITFSHYANEYDDAAKLASLTTSYFTGMSKHLRNSLNLLSFMPQMIKAPAPQISNYPDSAQKYFLSQVAFNMKFESNWTLRQESVLIKKFAIKLNAIEGTRSY